MFSKEIDKDKKNDTFSKDVFQEIDKDKKMTTFTKAGARCALGKIWDTSER